MTEPIVPVPAAAVIVVAAGSGTRLGAGVPKAFVALDERTILAHALDQVYAVNPSVQVIVVAPADRVGEAETEVAAHGRTAQELTRVVAGGATRQASVEAGLTAVWADVRTVLVHDAARALTPPAVFDRVIATVGQTGLGIIPVLPVVDTLKRVTGATVLGVVDRAELAAAQTPQGFPRELLEAAYRTAGAEHTDDAALVQAAGHQIQTVPGAATAFKITTLDDLDRARALLAGQPAVTASAPAVSPAVRVGIGTDVHAFGGDGTLWLAGLEWPGEGALSGHSDGDAVSHAIVDALLSAAGLGDIGTHFGTSRPEFAGAHAEAFLTETRRLLAEAGWTIGNVSVQVQAARPKFAPRRAEAEAALSALLGAPVSVAATTTDGLGFVGAGDGVQAFAVALIVPA